MTILLLTTSLLFVSCGGSLKSDTDNTIYKNDFESTTLGTYTLSQLENEWGTHSALGVEEGRVAISKSNDNTFMDVFYPASQYGVQDTGTQFKLDFGRLYEDVTLTYRLKFKDDFDFVKGGKLPGLAGGTAPSGGEKANGTNGWSGRIMWRKDGEIVQYMYYPDNSNPYGEDFPWNLNGKHYFKVNKWHTIKNHFIMNTPKQHDGVMQAWLDGELVLDRHDMHFRDTDSLGIDLFYFSTFFGGGDSSWSTTQDEKILFDDFEITFDK